jgi:hypothetical protein
LLDAGGYVLKALQVFFPGHDARLQAATLTMGDSGVDIAGAAMVEIRSGQECIPCHLAFGFDHHYQCGIEVWGSRGKLVTDRSFTAGPNVSPAARLESAAGTEKISLPTDNHFRRILEAFARSVAGGQFTAEYDAVLRQASLQEDVRRMAGFPAR